MSVQKRTARFVALMTMIGFAQTASAQTLLVTNARVLDVGARAERTANILIKDGESGALRRCLPVP